MSNEPAASNPPAIHIDFIGRHPISWLPQTRVPPSGTATTSSLREQFAQYLRGKISESETTQDNLDADILCDAQISMAATRADHFGLLAVALDTTSQLRHLNPEYLEFCLRSSNKDEVFQDIATMNIAPMHSLRGWWVPKKSDGTSKGRSAADRRAQKDVPEWYGSRCVLSGFGKPQAAHIVPVRATHVSQPLQVWDFLRMLWPLPEISDLKFNGQEQRNILPLSPDAHTLWDRYLFAVRPIEHPTDPEHYIYLQMVWLQDLDADDGLVRGKLNHSSFGTIADFRRGEDNLYPAVQHGDVYRLHTTNPTGRPLPSKRFLEIQFGLHKLLAGMKAAGSLKSVFKGNPPNAPGPVNLDVGVPPEWQFLIDAALDKGILSTLAANKWMRAVQVHVAQQNQLFENSDNDLTGEQSSPSVS